MNSSVSRKWVLVVCVVVCGVFAPGQRPVHANDGYQPLIRVAAPRTEIATCTPSNGAVAEQSTSANAYSEPLPPPTANAPAVRFPRGILAPLFNRSNYGYQSPPANETQQAVLPEPATPPANVTAPKVVQSQPLAPAAAPTTAPTSKVMAIDDMATIKLAQRGVAPPPTALTTVVPPTSPSAEEIQSSAEPAPIQVSEASTMPVQVAEAPSEPTNTQQPVAVSPVPTPTLPTAYPNQRIPTNQHHEPIADVAQQPTPAEPRPAAAKPVLTVHLEGPDKLQHGEFASIKVRIDNSSTSAMRDVILDIVANGQLLKTLDVGTVTAERSVEVEVQMTPQVLGPLELQAVAQSAVGERAVAVRSMFVGRPELTLAIAGRGTVNLGDAQRYTAIIANDGTADAEEVSLLVMLQGSEAQSLALGNVLAGQTRRVAFELQPGQSGALSLNAVATAIGGAQASANGSIQVLPERVEAAVEQASIATPAQ